MAGQKKPAAPAAPGSAPALPKKGSGQAKLAAKGSDAKEAERISKRACLHCGELIPIKKILTVQYIGPVEGVAGKSSTRSRQSNHYYNRDHYKVGA